MLNKIYEGNFLLRQTAPQIQSKSNTWGDYRESLQVSVHYYTLGTSGVLPSVNPCGTFQVWSDSNLNRQGSKWRPLRALSAGGADSPLKLGTSLRQIQDIKLLHLAVLVG
jgi:hypothetical protein